MSRNSLNSELQGTFHRERNTLNRSCLSSAVDSDESLAKGKVSELLNMPVKFLFSIARKIYGAVTYSIRVSIHILTCGYLCKSNEIDQKGLRKALQELLEAPTENRSAALDKFKTQFPKGPDYLNNLAVNHDRSSELRGMKESQKSTVEEWNATHLKDRLTEHESSWVQYDAPAIEGFIELLDEELNPDG